VPCRTATHDYTAPVRSKRFTDESKYVRNELTAAVTHGQIHDARAPMISDRNSPWADGAQTAGGRQSRFVHECSMSSADGIALNMWPRKQ
jgi:hypothetical protein